MSINVLVAVPVDVYDQVVFLYVDASYGLGVGGDLPLLGVALLGGDPTLPMINVLALVLTIWVVLVVLLPTGLIQVLRGASVRATSLEDQALGVAIGGGHHQTIRALVLVGLCPQVRSDGRWSHLVPAKSAQRAREALYVFSHRLLVLRMLVLRDS